MICDDGPAEHPGLHVLDSAWIRRSVYNILTYSRL